MSYKHYYKSIIIVSIVYFMAGATYGQVKYERESRTKKSLVPANAVTFINEAVADTKVNWYRETKLDGHSYEAKFKFNDYKYSVEFDSLGIIEDIEKVIEWEDMPIHIQSAICDYLNSNFDSFKIRKKQQQYTGPRDQLASLISNGKSSEIIISYELVVDTKEGSDRSYRELLFDSEGKLVSKVTIIKRITDNMDF